jgi:hypothetical protein
VTLNASTCVQTSVESNFQITRKVAVAKLSPGAALRRSGVTIRARAAPARNTSGATVN